MLRIVFTVLLFAFSIVAHGELYKWVDNNGNTQYTDQPPPPGAAKTEKKLKIKSAPAQPTGDEINAPKSLAEKEYDFKKRLHAEEQAEAKQQAETKENKEKCIQARSKLKIYQEAPKLIVSDGAGGVIRADDVARQKGIDEAQKEIESYCK
ncbi:MAG: DUF4124 domain-containing protein [Nitrosomonadaceae bacterium]